MLSLLRRPAPWPLARLTEEVSNDWARFRQAANSIYDDVTETQVTVTGTATVTNGKMVARPASVDNWAAMNPVTFDANENFFIRVTVKPDAPGASIVNLPFLSVYETTSAPETAWGIFQSGPAGTAPGKIFFNYRAADGELINITSPDVTPYTDTTTVEVVRINGVISLLVNGVRKGQVTQNKGNGRAAFPQMRPFRIATAWNTSIMAGEVWDVQVAKGDRTYVDSNHAVEPVPEYKRATYFPATADKIVAQYGFRKNSLADEKTGNSGTISGNTIMVRGRIRCDNTNASKYELPCPYFGAADFTVECNFKYTARSAGSQVYLLAQYNKGGTTPTTDDSWNIQVGGTTSPDTVRFVWYDGQTKRSCTFPTALTVGGSYHVVVERVGDQMTIYVDGVAGETVTFSAPLLVPVTNTVTSFIRDTTVTNLFAPKEIWNIRIAKAALYKGKILRKATFPKFSATSAFPAISRKTTFTALGLSMSGGGSVVQLSTPTFNDATNKLYLPMLHSDRTSRMGIFDVSGDTISTTNSPTHTTMGGSGVIRYGAMQSVARERTLETGKYATIHTWGTSSVPSGLEIGTVNESTRQLENFTTYTASIVSPVSNLNLQAGLYMDTTGSFGLAEYVDGNSDRYTKFRKVWYDSAAGKYAMGTSAQEFVGQQYMAPPRFVKDNLFVVGGTASTGQAYIQLLDVSGNTPVVIAAAASLGVPGLSWGRTQLEVFGDFILLMYVESGTFKAELYRFDGVSSLVRVDAVQWGGFATTATFCASVKMQDTAFALVYASSTQADLVKITVSNGKLARISNDRQAVILDASYTQASLVKISDTRLLLLRYTTAALCQYSFLDYTWRAETVPTKLAALYRFDNDEPVNEVTERYSSILGTANTANNRLNTATAYSNRMDDDAIVFAAGEDFTVEGRLLITSLAADGGLLVGVWTSGGQLGNAWSFHVRQPDGKVGFYFSVDGTNYGQVISDDILYVNNEYHLAAWRKDGVIRMAINGRVQSATLEENRACYRPARLLSTSWIGTNGWFAGWRDDIRICKEALYGDADFIPPATGLADAPRETYSTADAAAVVLQLGLRRESLQDEASDKVLTFTSGVTMSNGRITQANNNTAQYTIPSRQFGAGDFCAEMMLNVTAINATYGSVVMGNWRAGGVASDENRWCLILSTDRKLAFNMARSANANDFVALVSDAIVPLSTDTHIAVERVNGVVTLYMNGQPVISSNSTDFNFPIRGGTDNWKVHSISSQVAYSIGMTCWNMRIMDKAVYKGVFTPPVVYPALPAAEFVVIDHDKVHPDFSLVGGAVATADGVSIPNGGYLAGTTHPKYVFYRGDFTIDATLTVRSAIQGTGAGSANALTPLFSWSPWAASGQPLNWELYLQLTTNQIGFTTSYSDATVNRTSNYTVPIGTKINVKVVRKRNAMYFFADGVLIGHSTFQINIGYDTAQPIYIGRRRGGGSGEVNWFSDCLIEKLVIAKEARM